MSRVIANRGSQLSSEAGGPSTHHWTTLRYLVDPRREITVPTGVVLWNEEQRLSLRPPQEGERLPTAGGCADVSAAQARAYLEITRAMLTNGVLPISGRESTRTTDLWYT